MAKWTNLTHSQKVGAGTDNLSATTLEQHMIRRRLSWAMKLRTCQTKQWPTKSRTTDVSLARRFTSFRKGALKLPKSTASRLLRLDK
eukprot:5073491-Amphidinium_carterae.1